MKALKTIAAALLLTVSTGASAQSASSSSGSNSGNNEGWSSVWAEYGISKITNDWDSDLDRDFNAVSIGFSKAFGLSKNQPLFVEAGLGFQYSFYSETTDVPNFEGIYDDDRYDEYPLPGNYKTKVNMFSLKIPVNLIYKYDFPNSSFSIAPFVGVALRYNISGKLKKEAKFYLDEIYDDEDYDEDLYYDYSDYEYNKDFNLFDKKDMRKCGRNVWKRFQIGWNIGVKAMYKNKYSIGVAYASDFSEISKKCKISSFNISAAYHF